MEGVEIPEYFLCPISLQIMKDPVTTVTGITYDRPNIERWLIKAGGSDDSDNDGFVSCPVTNQPLSLDTVLTPNHTLRRLIQCWCTLNAVDRIPTPKSPVSKSHVSKLLRQLRYPSGHPDFIASLAKLETLASSDGSNKSNRKCLVEFGLTTAMVRLLIRLCKEGRALVGLRETLRILHNILTPQSDELKEMIASEPDIVTSITWVLTTRATDDDAALRAHAVMVMQKFVEVSGSILMERLDAAFFKGMVGFIARFGGRGNEKSLLPKATKAALRVLIDAAQWARNINRMVMISEAGAVHALIELELGGACESANKDKKATELVFRLLAQFCGSADGRERFLSHAAGIAMVAKRLLRVSAEVDEAAVQILAMVARNSAGVSTEMLKVGAVTKLCMVMQADCEKGLKDKAREVLRMHSVEWNNSPCIQMYLLTRYPTLHV